MCACLCAFKLKDDQFNILRNASMHTGKHIHTHVLKVILENIEISVEEGLSNNMECSEICLFSVYSKRIWGFFLLI